MYGIETKRLFLERVSTSTDGIRKICSEDGMPTMRNIMYWLQSDHDFRSAYEEAKAFQQELKLEEMEDIADRPSKDLVEAMDKKLQIDVRKWAASKLAPKRFGENKNVNIDVGVKKVMSGDDMLALRSELKQLISAPRNADAEDIEHEDII